MIRFAFDKPNVSEWRRGGGTVPVVVKWNVTHPSNGGVIAYCDTKPEAEAVVGLIAGLVAFVKESQQVNTPAETPASKKGSDT